MSGAPCLNPNFPFNEAAGWHEACTNCGRLAWDHEQADPMADIRNTVRQAREGYERPDPPAMKRDARPVVASSGEAE